MEDETVLRRFARLPRSMSQRWTRLQRLRRALPMWDAVRIVARSTRDRSTLRVAVPSIGRHVTVRVNTSDVACLEKVFIDEEYRLPSDANAQFLIRPRLIVDAGANIGMSTLYFAHAFPEASIIAIEPEALNFAVLQRNCAGLGQVTLKQAALWSSSGTLHIADAAVDNWSFSVQPGPSDERSIPSITIADVLAASGMERIDLLKLDVEGAERELFGDSCEEWLPKVGVIIIELHDRLLSGCGQRFYSHLVRRHFTQEIRGENIFINLSAGQ